MATFLLAVTGFRGCSAFKRQKNYGVKTGALHASLTRTYRRLVLSTLQLARQSSFETRSALSYLDRRRF